MCNSEIIDLLRIFIVLFPLKNKNIQKFSYFSRKSSAIIIKLFYSISKYEYAYGLFFLLLKARISNFLARSRCRNKQWYTSSYVFFLFQLTT